MMKIELCETHGWEAAIRGMRNPMESWEKSSSRMMEDVNDIILCENDYNLMIKLCKAGPSHRKFLRFINITCDVTANSIFWREWDTYKFTIRNSTSQMHKLGSRLLTQDDFSDPIPNELLNEINKRVEYWRFSSGLKYEEAWREMISIIPQSYLYKSTISMNYEVFITQYLMRYKHKLKEWREYCEYLRHELQYMNDILVNVYNI